MNHFVDDQHAYLSGLLLGHLFKMGVEVDASTDEHENYCPDINILIPDLEQVVTVRVMTENTVVGVLLPEPGPVLREEADFGPPAAADFSLSFKALPGTDAEEAYHALARDLHERYGLEEV